MGHALSRNAAKRPLRRFVLGALALALLAGPTAASGCAGGFAPISQVDGLRILSVQADKPYADPGDTVTFRMTYSDPPAGSLPLQILWLGGCVNPPGDAYYGCYQSLQGLFTGGFDLDDLLQKGLVGVGKTYSVKLPETIISSRPPAQGGAPRYGVAYVFFMACAGTLEPIPLEGTGAAESFPIGCFDAQHRRLGAEHFVPGFTQVYAFEDQRPNENPTITGMTKNGEALPEDDSHAPDVEACPVSEEERLGPPSCGKKDAFQTCPSYDISITVPANVAEDDPSSTSPDGTTFKETVWVDYFADRGDFDGDARLVSDATEGQRTDFAVTWIAPPEPGPVRIWAVIHDNRGGQDVIERVVNVK
ncbi:Hypothetical protein A7982_04930 [Minicystis rosea]|nr:Hypothetical protein A7982_04930 [Minicystis rosea]